MRRRRRGKGSTRWWTSLLLRLILVLALATVVPVLCLRWLAPPTSAFMLRSLVMAAWQQRDDFQLRFRWVDWSEISPHAKLAVVAAEDQMFPQHMGFDVNAISNALDGNRNGRRLRGASTISQQLAKNLFLWPGRSYLRKGIEVYLTALIELCWPKRRILEMYLNVVEFGDGIFGIAAASEAFFHKSPGALKPAQAALLAAVLPNPRKLRVDRPSAYVRERQMWILDQMARLRGAGYLQQI